MADRALTSGDGAMDDGHRTAAVAAAASVAMDVDIDRPPPWEADAARHDEKHSRYEAAYSRRLRAKYFSKKALDGGDIFDFEVIIQDESIKTSRWPCTKSFADPFRYLEDQKQPSVGAEAAAMPNKKQCSKKSC